MKTERTKALPVFTEQLVQDFLRAQHACHGGAKGQPHAFGRYRAKPRAKPRLSDRFLRRNPRELIRARAAHFASQGSHICAHLANQVPIVTRGGEERQRPQTAAA